MGRLALYYDEVDCCAFVPNQFCSIVVAAAMEDELILIILIVAMACCVSTVRREEMTVIDIGDLTARLTKGLTDKGV